MLHTSVYYFVFSIPVFFYITSLFFNKNLNNIFLFIVLTFFALFVGSRVEIGGDWGTYINNFYEKGENFNIFNFNIRSDWGFEILSFLFYYSNQPIFFLNLFISFINFFCIYLFIKNYQNKWLFLILSVPYFLVVVQMGYVRQASALSFVILGIIALRNNKYFHYVIYFFLGIMFHKSSLIIFLIMLISINNFYKIFFKNILFFIFIILAIYLSKSDFGNLLSNYILNTTITSQGAFPRLFLNILASIIFLIFYKKIKISKYEKKLYLNISILIFFLIILTFSYSTFVDRLQIYFLPFQLIVFSSLHNITRNRIYKFYINTFIILLFFLYLFTWLEFSNSSHRWLPYKSFLLGSNLSYNYNTDQLLSCDEYNKIYGFFIKNDGNINGC